MQTICCTFSTSRAITTAENYLNATKNNNERTYSTLAKNKGSLIVIHFRSFFNPFQHIEILQSINRKVFESPTVE